MKKVFVVTTQTALEVSSVVKEMKTQILELPILTMFSLPSLLSSNPLLLKGGVMLW